MVRRLIVLFLGLIFISLIKADLGYCSFRLGKSGPKVSGFLESVVGFKLGSDTTKRDEVNIFEQRLQLKTALYPEWTPLLKDWMAVVNFRADTTLDWYYDGKTDFDLRELNLVLSPLSWLDMRLGRQVLTWGTGDYLFVNDLFPKDYVSFYLGRDDEYLKKPSDAGRFSIYTDWLNADFVVLPFFEPNTIPKGDRLSFFDSFQGGIAGVDSDRRLIEPGTQADNFQYALRLYRNFNSYEMAFYAFRGFYGVPAGYFDESKRELFYPRLDAYGASLRGPALGGIVNVEFAFYNSVQDANGDNRLISNSMLKGLIGYDKDLGSDWRMGVQYLYEQTLDYDAYQDALLAQDFRWDEFRHLFTLRVTKLFKNQTVKVNFFTFFSPSDMDVYLRPSVDYDINDDFKVTLGANLVWGRDDYTEFGQMENNKNIYIRVRYSF